MGKIEGLKEKIRLFKIRNSELSLAMKEQVVADVTKSQKKMDLISLLREAFVYNELPSSDMEKAYTVSLARTKRSGCTFGLCQFDVSVNKNAKLFIDKYVDFPDEKYKDIFFSIRGKDISYDENGSPIPQDPFEHLRPEELESISIVDEQFKKKEIRNSLDVLDNAQLEKLIDHIKEVFQNVIVLDESKIVHLADMANQYGNLSFNGGTVLACKDWYSKNNNEKKDFYNYEKKIGETREQLFWAANTCIKICNEVLVDLDSWEAFFLFFKLRTKHGRQHPYDPIRRWKNIIAIFKGRK